MASVRSLLNGAQGPQIQINIAETPMHVKSGVKSMVLSNHICDLKNAKGPIWTLTSAEYSVKRCGLIYKFHIVAYNDD